MKIKLGDKALEVLKGISVINQETVLRNDYLYTKYDFSIEDSKSKGIEDVIVSYDLPEGEIEVTEEIGLGNINEFLSIYNSFDKESLTLAPNGTTIKMKDKRKSVTFFTTTVDALPKKEELGMQLYDEGETIIKFVIDEAGLEQIKKDLKILNIDKLSVVSTESGGVEILAQNSVSSNDTSISIEDRFVSKGEGEFTFSNSSIFEVIMAGIYTIEVKKCKYDESEIFICKLENKSIPGLYYINVSNS